MIVLGERYTKETDYLQITLRTIGLECQFVFAEDNFDLPSDMLSISEFFLQKKEAEQLQERDLYYAFLEVPHLWQVRDDGLWGKIVHAGQKKAQIFFKKPIEKRFVERVEWLSEKGKVYKTDYYNKYGVVYCRGLRDEDEKLLLKSYYTSKGEEVISCNERTGSIILFEDGMVKFTFDSKRQFEKYMCEQLYATGESVIVTSLRLAEMFQEVAGKQVDNVIVMLNDPIEVEAYRLDYPLMVANNCRTASCDASTLKRFSYCSAMVPCINNIGDILILTASDKLENIETLVECFPEKVFHIAAPTKVSDKLWALTNYANVKVYPVVKVEQLQHLLEISDIYLDINHYREVDDIVIRASMGHMVILGFENTLHNRPYMLDECIFRQDDCEGFVAKLQEILESESTFRSVLLKQQQQISSTTAALFS